ncbi:hypothetical protein HDK90DRAFT_469818 [Phyllosticta capitalensis]|uniref:Uncharacterized protein n=1 Tax=Phyllosticta capitalensis TaxID=121624 RepID=A0ABR1YD78_9PEZI
MAPETATAGSLPSKRAHRRNASSTLDCDLLLHPSRSTLNLPVRFTLLHLHNTYGGDFQQRPQNSLPVPCLNIMGRLTTGAKKATRKLKHMLQRKSHENSLKRAQHQQCKSSLDACTAHLVRGCRCGEIENFTSANKHTSVILSSGANTNSTVSLDSLTMEGMQELRRCNNLDDDKAIIRSKRRSHEPTGAELHLKIRDVKAGERDFSFSLDEPEHLSTPDGISMGTAKHSNTNKSIRRLPRLPFLELARMQRDEAQSQDLDLQDGEEYYLAPEEMGPVNYPYKLTYSNFTASPKVEKRRSI